MKKIQTIKVTVDKGHLLTLGERMYVESIELVRELVANAYDADATEVHVNISADSIVVEDNGSGMDVKGLSQFFTIGSEEKRVRSISPRFGRKRIGQFGIGKFAALAAADEFRVETKRYSQVHEVVFNKNDWSGQAGWELPIVSEPATPLHHDGTKVTLLKLRKQFSALDIERFLRESVPLHAKKFTVYLNGKRIASKFIPGRRIPVRVQTIFGLIDGDIVIAAMPKDVKNVGIECRSRHVLVCRDLFGLDREYARESRRITGGLNADFLPVTAGRDDFVRDSQEFKIFAQVVRAELEKILKEIRQDAAKRNLEKVSNELREALDKIRSALKMNPEFAPQKGSLVRRQKRGNGIIAGSISSEDKKLEKKEGDEAEKDALNAGKEKSQEKEKLKLPKPQIIKKIRINKLGISVGVVSLGKDGVEVISEGSSVYVNQDHPLYVSLSKRHEQFSLHLLRLITQEIVLMKKLRLPARDAFEIQSKLLTDAIVEEK